MQYICKENGFKMVQSVDVCEQFRLAKLAPDEIVQFKKYRGEEDWPENMDPIKLNIQQTTMSNAELSSNNGNEFKFLSSIREMLSKLNPLLIDK